MKLVRISAIFLGCAMLALMPLDADAFDREQSLRELQAQYDDASRPDHRIVQSSGLNLSQATEQVRRQTGGKILSATTKVIGNREVHHIKVLTDDGKVKNHKIQGRKRG